MSPPIQTLPLAVISAYQASSPLDGQSWLPSVHVELEHIRSIIENSPSAQTTLLEFSVETWRTHALAQMKDVRCVHFACHGVQDSKNSTGSTLFRRSTPLDAVGHHCAVPSPSQWQIRFSLCLSEATDDTFISLQGCCGLRRRHWYDAVDQQSCRIFRGQERIRTPSPDRRDARLWGSCTVLSDVFEEAAHGSSSGFHSSM
ncbi:hypothetical protein J3R83DRAFT_13253 [Lanmaoa asiatica]|nr:hypothetical protein J3R83DRAFT_13253 [Lanmaoa asiatica]